MSSCYLLVDQIQVNFESHVISSDCIKVTSGVFKKTTMEIPIRDIEDFWLYQNFFQRRANTGRMRLLTKSTYTEDGRCTFESICFQDIKEFQKVIELVSNNRT
jgi:uncharacterized membrane protein YdbT with pleckstrin-like domain